MDSKQQQIVQTYFAQLSTHALTPQEIDAIHDSYARLLLTQNTDWKNIDEFTQLIEQIKRETALQLPITIY
ncbi:hypothetical protein M5252_004572 [Vibrio parahaemolyticus]|nr:hypothetical protein [Vibrio parahaemolyticus]EJE8775019.1 hypothetical protein [Vibrio parahaemolyticus]